ncbi:helix-turn-helix domain-containing protein [Chthoniobacter flavus]|uniref:helix-turn-helix domain-containing protein n=1 Tax=Chthoniobacter flavus TaxID=191863 RepID=UPI003B433C2B
MRRKLIEMRLTQMQVAEILGVAYQTVERWERNRTPITKRNQTKIVSFLGFNPLAESRHPSS